MLGGTAQQSTDVVAPSSSARPTPAEENETAQPLTQQQASPTTNSMAAQIAMRPTSNDVHASNTPTPSADQGSSHNYELTSLFPHVQDLLVSEKRAQALSDLSKRREYYPDLAPVLWHSFGTMVVLLQEVVAIYPRLSPPSLTAQESNRVCNSLALLQCVASHPDTRQYFLTARIPLFLYPFLNTIAKQKPFEYLRLTSLGVIGALVKVDDTEVTKFLLQTEIVPLCLRIMESGSELSKTVATFIVQKILLDNVGLNYICATFERFISVTNVMEAMVKGLEENPSGRLLKQIIRCYLRLVDHPRAHKTLRECLPKALLGGPLRQHLQDEQSQKWLNQLLQSLVTDAGPAESSLSNSGTTDGSGVPANQPTTRPIEGVHSPDT